MSTQPQGAPAPLPERPSLRHLKDEAKDLFKADGAVSIADAQFKVARRYGFSSWPKLKAHVETVAVIPELIEAVNAGDLERVRRFINKHPRLLNATLCAPGESSDSASTALQRAIRRSKVEIVRFLVSSGADPNQKNDGGRTPVHLAIEHCQGVIDFLIDHGARIDIAVAANRGRLDRLRELLRSDPALANHSGNGSTPLEWAAWGGQVECIRILLEHGAQVESDRSAAKASIRMNSLETLRVLLDHVHARQSYINSLHLLHTVIGVAHTHPNAPIIRFLLENGADLAALNKEGQRPIDLARLMRREPKDPWGETTPEEVARRLDQVLAILQAATTDK